MSCIMVPVSQLWTKSEAAVKRRSVRSAKPSMEAAAERRVSAESVPVLSSIWAVALRASLTAVTASLMVGNIGDSALDALV